MTKEEFKQRWESDENGGGITFDDIADCAKSWGISARPRTMPMELLRYRVLVEANAEDAKDFCPYEEFEDLAV